MKKKLNWTAYSNETRIEIIEKIKEAISTNDGYIIYFNMFSDLALTLSIEIPEDRIIEMHNAMKNILKISDIESRNDIQKSKKEWLVLMNISFSKGKGDFKTEIPAVPG